MLKRVLTAVALLAVVFGFLLGLRQIHVVFASGLIGLISVVATYEMCQAFKKSEYNPMKILLLATAVIAACATHFFGYAGLVLSVMFAVLVALIIFTLVHKYELKDMIATAFIIVYPIAPLSLLIHLNNFDVVPSQVGVAYNSTGNLGLYAILLTIILPILVDSMAYFFGVLLGKYFPKKLCPDISPKKTIIGAIGGVVGGMLGAILIWLAFDKFHIFESFNNVAYFALTDETWKSIIIYCVLGLVAAPLLELGDLVASWIKRKAGIKDYGKLFPGHGGMMDRMDSIIYMIPITCLFLEIAVRI